MPRKTPISLTSTVADVLADVPATAAAFMKRRLDCVGCDMAAFETIGDVAANYRLDAAELLSDIRRASRTRRGNSQTDE